MHAASNSDVCEQNNDEYLHIVAFPYKAVFQK
jgi:hypothetical protein